MQNHEARPAQSTDRDIAATSGAGPITVPSFGNAAAAEAKTKAFDEDTAKKEMVRKAAPAAEPSAKDAYAAGTVGKLDRAGSPDAVMGANAAPLPPPPAAPATRNEAASAVRQGIVGGVVPGAPMMVARARSAEVGRWRVSSAGAVERSNDGSKWEKVEIDPQVTFRSISTNHDDLWAGGTGGALFHSADAGRTWSRVKVGDDGMWVSDAITGVSFATPQNGFVTTASGAVWSTLDAGRTWQRRQ
jgi:hypothetical protein